MDFAARFSDIIPPPTYNSRRGNVRGSGAAGLPAPQVPRAAGALAQVSRGGCHPCGQRDSAGAVIRSDRLSTRAAPHRFILPCFIPRPSFRASDPAPSRSPASPSIAAASRQSATWRRALTSPPKCRRRCRCCCTRKGAATCRRQSRRCTSRQADLRMSIPSLPPSLQQRRLLWSHQEDARMPRLRSMRPFDVVEVCCVLCKKQEVANCVLSLITHSIVKFSGRALRGTLPRCVDRRRRCTRTPYCPAAAAKAAAAPSFQSILNAEAG